MAIANARLYHSAATRAEHMRRAMGTRAVIEQAKDILIAQRHCNPEQAFELLIRLRSLGVGGEQRSVAFRMLLWTPAAVTPEK